MGELRIRAMTHREFDAYRERSIGAYAAEHVRTGNWSPAEAEQRAETETDGLLPQGVDTPGMALLVGETKGEVVGLVWVGPAPEQRAGWWIYDIEIVSEQRRRGYGRALLEAAEREVRARGGDSVGLNVFGGNVVARGLYESAGYEVAATVMRKRLGC
ncbi:MAG: GNAT family N-acetyltransferase [Solirubrobacteraceae bacterium]